MNKLYDHRNDKPKQERINSAFAARHGIQPDDKRIIREIITNDEGSRERAQEQAKRTGNILRHYT